MKIEVNYILKVDVVRIDGVEYDDAIVELVYDKPIKIGDIIHTPTILIIDTQYYKDK